MFAAFGRFAFRHRVAIVVVYALLIPLGVVMSRGVLPKLRAGGFEDPAAESWRVYDKLVRTLGIGAGDIVAIYTVPTGTVDDVAVLSAVLPAVEAVKADPSVIRVASMWDTGADTFVSRDRRRTFVAVSVHGDDEEKFRVLARLRPLLEQPTKDMEGLRMDLGGISAVNQAVFRTIEHDLQVAELLAFPLTALLLVVIFQSLASAALPLLMGACAVAFAMVAMRGLVAVIDVSIFAANTISILGLGLAIDYSLFLVARFREELHAGRDVEDAVVATMTTTGRAVAFSGLTVLASAGGLFAFPQMLLRSVAWGSLAVVAGSLLMAVTLLPALLALLGPRVDALRIPWFPPRPPAEGSGFWFAVSRAVMKRPVIVAVVVVVGMLALAMPFERFDASLPDHRILPRETPARVAMEILNDEFLPHQLSAHEVVVTFADGDVFDPRFARAHLDVLDQLQKQMKAIAGVSRVDGPLTLADHVGRERAITMLLAPRSEQDGTLAAVLDAITEGPHVRIGVVSAAVFNEATSLRQVDALRNLTVPPGVHVEVGGVSAILVDLRQTVRDRSPLMIGFVSSVMFLVLFLVFGSVTIPIKAMIMNSLSLTASFGALVWVFQDGRFTRLLHYEPLYISDATQPLVLFAVVFGLSMDYEVLLLSRVREEYVRTGDNEASVAHGLARTGRLITNAASLLVVVVGAFITSDILFMKTLGVGMALAVALDATVIRALLVPATMRLMGRWNWWAPAPLHRLWVKAGLGDVPHG
jgi:RND superfamily putative drug exporter